MQHPERKTVGDVRPPTRDIEAALIGGLTPARAAAVRGVPARRATSSATRNPRRRNDAREVGIGTRMPPPTLSTADRSAGARSRARPVRDSSFSARIAREGTPSNRSPLHTVTDSRSRRPGIGRRHSRQASQGRCRARRTRRRPRKHQGECVGEAERTVVATWWRVPSGQHRGAYTRRDQTARSVENSAPQRSGRRGRYSGMPCWVASTRTSDTVSCQLAPR